MTVTLRASRIRSFLERKSAAAAVPIADPWPDTLAQLARAHRARRAAPDPRRPWLSDGSKVVGAGDGVTRSDQPAGVRT